MVTGYSSTKGQVTRTGAVTDCAALTAAPSAAAPTKAEFDKVVADNVTIRAKLNEALAALRDASIIA